MDDNKIIELFFARSESAISELSEKYGSYCRRIAKNILRDERDAEECVNDSYLAVWNTIPPNRPDPLLTYVCKIVRNLASKKYHSNTAVKRNSYYDAVLDELENTIPSPTIVEDELDRLELSRLIDSFLDTLDKESRVMFVRRYWYSDSLNDIAKMFAVSENHAAVKLFRIKGKLKKYLTDKRSSQ
ncbi:MAG: sigma-70 family RNA polymerase sigma factor [Eubacterium sp.]|nr:sigma-70 family RNA polymerase sigma factor [Eubacterium sp.]